MNSNGDEFIVVDDPVGMEDDEEGRSGGGNSTTTTNTSSEPALTVTATFGTAVTTSPGVVVAAPSTSSSPSFSCGITTLQRQSLSIILSFLTEYDATNLLLCRKVWTVHLLPIFRIVPRSSHTRSSAGVAVGPPAARAKHRHRFMVVPVPDPMTRLERLNTKRLYERRRRRRRQQRTSGTHPPGHLSSASAAEGGGAPANSRNDRNDYSTDYLMTTTQQIALKEWLALIEHDEGDVNSRGHTTTMNNSTVSTARVASTYTGSAEKSNDNGDGEEHCEYQRQQKDQYSSQPPLLQFYNPKHHHLYHKNNHHHSSPRTSLSSLSLFRPGTTVLASYPRSGNTLLRQLLESVTGFVTGSDTRPDRPLSLSLANDFGLVGEGVTGSLSSSMYVESYSKVSSSNSIISSCFNDRSKTDSTTTPSIPSTPIVKTHWPERIGWYPYDCHRVILLVRNPWDAIDSYWHLNATNTHTEKVVDGVYEDHYKFWIQFVRNEFIVWNDFLTYWHHHQQQQNSNLEVLWVRYEDLVLRQEQELERILKFCCCGLGDVSSSDDTGSRCCCRSCRSQCLWWKRRLVNHIASSTLPSASSSISRSIGRMIRQKRYPIDLLKNLHSIYDEHTSDVATTSSGTMNNKKIKKDINWIKVLGYDIFEQDFPNNLDSLPSLHPTTMTVDASGGAGAVMKVNEPRSLELRSSDSPYGRNMRDWRRQHTKNDNQPFQVVAASKSSMKYRKT